MDLKPSERRAGFDEIVDGWGSDSLDDLAARAELMMEFWTQHLPLTPAEHKVAKAITKRLCDLGGLELPSLQ